MQTQHPASTLLGQLWQQMQQGQQQDAINTCQALNQQHPAFAAGWHAASFLALQLGAAEHALNSINRALSLQAGVPAFELQKARCLHANGDAATAVTILTALIQESAPDAQLLSETGMVAHTMGQHLLAREAFTKALELQPDQARLHYNLATVLRFLGELDAADHHCQQALDLNPADFDSHFLRAGLRRQSLEDNHIAQLEAALPSAQGNPLGSALVQHALAKELEDVGRYEQSFSALQQGAKARRKSFQYDVSEDIAFIDAIIETYGTARLQQADDGHEDASPVFITGLPRTGTTLAERMLASHDQVTSIGESTWFTRLIAGMAQQLGEPESPTRAAMVAVTTNIDFRQLGQAYVANARPQATEQRFIDKFPQNAQYLGPIHMALPHASLVVLERHPMDSCYAIYKQLFTDIYHFSYDLAELAQYFIAHQRIIKHWLEVLPGKIHVLRYEDLVTNPEAELRQLLTFCNLPWQEQCLDFQNNPQASTTASASQVREKIHTRSIGNWRHYEKQLEPLRIMLEDAGCFEGWDS